MNAMVLQSPGQTLIYSALQPSCGGQGNWIEQCNMGTCERTVACPHVQAAVG